MKLFLQSAAIALPFIATVMFFTDLSAVTELRFGGLSHIESHEPEGVNEMSLVEEYELDHDRLLWKSLSFSIWCEARQGNEEEMRYVASVKYSRARERDWNYYDVVHAPRQFSCMGSDGHSPIDQSLQPADLEAYDTASQIALELLQGVFEPMIVANHYYAHGKIDPPSWSSEMALVVQTDYHTYLYD